MSVQNREGSGLQLLTVPKPIPRPLPLHNILSHPGPEPNLDASLLHLLLGLSKGPPHITGTGERGRRTSPANVGPIVRTGADRRHHERV